MFSYIKMSSGIILFNNNFPQTKVLNKIFNLDFNAIGFFYSCSYTLEKKVLIVDLFSYVIPSINDSFNYNDIFKADFISSIDTYYIDHAKFRILLLEFFSQEIILNKNDFKKTIETFSLPGKIILDLFLSKLEIQLSNFTRQHFDSKPYYSSDLEKISEDIISNLNFTENKNYVNNLFLVEKYKKIIQDILNENINPEDLLEFKIQKNFSNGPEENLQKLFSDLFSNLKNNKPVFIDIDFLLENINKLSNLDLKSPNDFSVLAGIYSKKTEFINFKSDKEYYIIPMRNYNSDLESLQSLQSLQDLKSLAEISDFELNSDINNQILKLES